MRYSRLLYFLVSIQFVLSCDSENERIVCRPLTVKRDTYTEEYVYNEAHRVETILYHVPYAGTRTGDLDYNEKGQLIRLSLFDFSSPPKVYLTYELIYDGQERPQKLYLWPSVPSGSPTEIVDFYHNENQQLIKIENTEGYARRYEYDSNDNVIKVFRTFDTEELLYAENFLYDSAPRLFGHASELETLSVYMHGYHPGRNNIVAATIHEDEPGYPKSDARRVTYSVGYNENGLITSCQPGTVFMFGTLYFDEVTYRCK